MNKITLLNEYLEMESHNLYCYSKNLLMTIPKKGYEKEYNDTLIKIDLLKNLIKKIK